MNKSNKAIFYRLTVVAGFGTLIAVFAVIKYTTDCQKPYSAVCYGSEYDHVHATRYIAEADLDLTYHHKGEENIPQSTNINGSAGMVTVTLKNDINAASNNITPYLLFVEITEQLSSNTIKFIQLSYFSALWNLSMVEPWIDINTTFLTSLPTPTQMKTILYFDLYKKTEVEASLTKCFNFNLPPAFRKNFHFHRLSEALIYSPRDVLVVRFMTKRWSRTQDNGKCSAISISQSQMVLNRLNTLVEGVKNKARALHGGKYRFVIWETVCITAIRNVPFSIKKATEFIKKRRAIKLRETNADVTVVIPSWRKVKKKRPKCYYYDPNFDFDERYCQDHGLPHGSIVLNATKRLLKSVGLEEKFIGIYARTERLSQYNLRKPRYMAGCFKDFREVVRKIQETPDTQNLTFILVHDAGKHGSKSFTQNLQERSNRILSIFRKWGVRTVRYDPEQNRDFPQHRAFVAAVEQEFLSRSHVLVTMGGGGFTMNVKQRFVARQGTKRLHVLCTE